MKAIEEGFILLTSHMGDPERAVMTVAQLRKLSSRVRDMKRDDAQRDLTQQDLVAIGYDRTMAQRILQLLSEEDRLAAYLQYAKREHCVAITRANMQYPLRLRKRLGLDSPGCLWAKGDMKLLEKPAVALVGSRALLPENRSFAREVGYQAAKQGYVLVSGNAAGADRTAQNACLEAGGSVISVVADALLDHKQEERVLYLSEDSFDLPFTAQRALSRNRVIHCLGNVTFVAQCDLGRGGTWDGTMKNVQGNWSPVFCFSDGSDAMEHLEQLGAEPVRADQMKDFSKLQKKQLDFLDQ